MTITQATDAPLVVVCGATGVQGGSVINALAESDRPYRFRGFTRDTTKAVAQVLAKRGVEMVQITLSLDHESAIRKAFAGAKIAFVMTNFWEHMNKQREIDEGQMLVRVANSVGVDLLVWSGLENVTEMSNGKYKDVYPCDSKAAVTRYAQEIGVPFVNVQAGVYASNYTTQWFPRKQEDGSYVLAMPYDPDSVTPIIDMVSDYGLFVREAIESPAFGAGTEVLSCGEVISYRDIVSQLAEITGKRMTFVQISDEEFLSKFPLPPIVAEVVRQSIRAQDEFEYYGKKDIGPSLQHLARKPRTWAEYAREQDWNTILGC